MTNDDGQTTKWIDAIELADWLRDKLDGAPSKVASPKEKTPPSDATSQ